MKQADLILGCHGREEHGICLCGGTSSAILDLLSVHPTDKKFHDYMYKLMRLDQRPITDHNAVISTLQFLRGTYLPDKQFEVIGEWLRFHKRCGVYMYRSTID